MSISSRSEPNSTEPQPSWLRAGAVFAYRGGTEKVLAISAATIETVSSDSFVTWSTTGFLRDVDAGAIMHRPDGLQIRPQPSAQQPKGSTVTPAAAQAFAELYQGFDNRGQPQKVILGWMANITHGRPAEPWQHLIGLALIELGAEEFGLGARIANPAGAGRRSSRRAEAAETQTLITRFAHYLAGGEPITQIDLGWLRALLERGMASVGLMPPTAVLPPGRPRDRGNSARAILQTMEATNSSLDRGWLAQAIRESAHYTILRQRRIWAAWRDEDHTKIVVSPDDPDVVQQTIRIENSLHRIRSRLIDIAG